MPPRGASFTRLNVKIRFLQIVNRSIGRLTHPSHELPLNSEPEFEGVDKLEIGGQTFVPWQEAVERDVSAPPLLQPSFPPINLGYLRFLREENLSLSADEKRFDRRRHHPRVGDALRFTRNRLEAMSG